jgi:hypothetical protein
MSIAIATMGMYWTRDRGSSGIGYGGEMMEVPAAKKKKRLKVSVSGVNTLEEEIKLEVTPIEV